MKARRQHRKDRAGFTLMELLVVIAIIGILAAIIFPAVNSALKRAEITKAQADMASIVSAVRGFSETYGVPPVQNSFLGHADWTYGRKGGVGEQQNKVMSILRGIDATNNPRRTVFLEVPLESLQSAGDKDDATYSVADGYYIDPWGNPYMIIMDSDFDGKIGGIAIDEDARNYVNSFSPQNNETFPGVTVGVMSYGPSPDDPENSFLKSW